MFDVTYIGHAGWLIKNRDFKILCDPWFNPAGAFFSAWHPFPDNSHLLSQELLTDLDFVYISHAHQDHCDPWTLNQIDKSTLILIPKFKDRVLYNIIEQLGFVHIVELGTDYEWRLKDIKVKLLLDERIIETDSALLLDDGVDKILNLNDCHASFEQVKSFAGNVELLLLQSSSAIWWPCVYNYDEQQMKTAGALKRMNSIKRAVEYSKQLNAKFVVPNAGPPVFLSPEGEYWDSTRRESFNPFVLNDEVHQYFIKHGVPSLFLIPGSRLLLDHCVIEEVVDYKEREQIYQKLESYLKDYRQRRAPHCMNLEVNTAELKEAVEKFGAQIKKIKQHSKIFTKKVDFPFLVDFDKHGKWIIDFSKDVEECCVKYEEGYYNYTFKFDPHLVAMLFRNEFIDFEDYFLSMRFKCDRAVDQFSEFLFAIFKNFDLKRLAIAEVNYLSENPLHIDEEEMFELVCNQGRTLSVKRYCPHRQVDLKECGYLNEANELVCPLHGWKFSLDTGHCVNNVAPHSIFKEQ